MEVVFLNRMEEGVGVYRGLGREIGARMALPDPNDLAAKLALVHSGPSRVEGRLRMQELSLENVARRLVAFYGEVLDSAEERRAH